MQSSKTHDEDDTLVHSSSPLSEKLAMFTLFSLVKYSSFDVTSVHWKRLVVKPHFVV